MLRRDIRTGFTIYLIAVNIAAFLLFGIDKRRATRGEWRVPESTLLFLAFLGGAPGAMIGMRAFHHKTKHPKFYVGIPVVFLAEVAVVCFSHIREIIF